MKNDSSKNEPKYKTGCPHCGKQTTLLADSTGVSWLICDDCLEKHHSDPPARQRVGDSS